MKGVIIWIAWSSMVILFFGLPARGAPPTIAERFYLESIEFDDSMGGSIVLKQSIATDPVKMRSKMVADGLLVNGHLEQIVRCDLHNPGYFLNIQQKTGQKGIQCQNATRYCNASPQRFWDFPSNTSLIGLSPLPNSTKGGKIFNKYEYWINSEKYHLFVDDKNHPVWLGKVYTWHSLYHLWHFEYTKFVPGPPSILQFAAPPGLHCSTGMQNQKKLFGASTQLQGDQNGSPVPFMLSDVETTPRKQIAPNVFMPYVNLGHPDTPVRNETAALELWLSRKVNGSGIDTAFDYLNQNEVGAAIRESGRERTELFITTKIPNVYPREQTLKYIKKDLQQLGLKYVDLVLIHSPCYSGFPSSGCDHATATDIQDAWKGMMDAKKLNLARSIGVSNFLEKDIQPILDLKDAIKPSLNQCEMYVGAHDDPTRTFCQSHGITYEAYSPLGRGKLNISDARIATIAERHSVSPYQVCLRWIVQQGCTIAVSSTKLSHDLSDLDIFNFELSNAEMDTLSSI